MKQTKQVKPNKSATDILSAKKTTAPDFTKANQKKTSTTNVKKNNDEIVITGSDKFKIALGIIFLALSIWGYYFFKTPNAIFSSPNLLLSYASPVIGIIVLLLVIFYWCSFGTKIISYIKEATIELKKVVWPDRKTATRMTLLVLVFVFILALFMWISDSLIQWVLYDLLLKR